MIIARAERGGTTGKLVLNEYRALIGDHENILEMDSGKLHINCT